MHPFILQQTAAEHVKDQLAAADDTRRARQARRARSRASRQRTPLSLPGTQAVLERRSPTIAAAVPVAGVAWARSSLTITFGDFPVLDLLAVLVGLPLVAAAGGWLLAGRQPQVIARQPLE
jgi:hypothetical protein